MARAILFLMLVTVSLPASETYLNGKLKSDYSTTGNEKIRRDYFDRGGLKSITPFLAVGPEPERDAVPHGLRRRFDEEGKLLSEQTFQNGVLDGPSRFYSPPGVLQTLERYANGKLETRSEFDSAGRIRSSDEFYPDGSRKTPAPAKKVAEPPLAKPEKLRYVNGAKQGPHVEYYSDGQIKFEANYEGGLYDGPYKSFYPNGLLSQTGTFVRGEKSGIETGYFQNNRIEYRVTYQNGKRQGKAQFNFPDGKVKWEVDYVSGVSHGTAVCFFRDGKGREVIQFENGLRRQSKGYDAAPSLIWQEHFYEDGSVRNGIPGDSSRISSWENEHCRRPPE